MFEITTVEPTGKRARGAVGAFAPTEKRTRKGTVLIDDPC